MSLNQDGRIEILDVLAVHAGHPELAHLGKILELFQDGTAPLGANIDNT